MTDRYPGRRPQKKAKGKVRCTPSILSRPFIPDCPVVQRIPGAAFPFPDPSTTAGHTCPSASSGRFFRFCKPVLSRAPPFSLLSSGTYERSVDRRRERGNASNASAFARGPTSRMYKTVYSPRLYLQISRREPSQLKFRPPRECQRRLHPPRATRGSAP